jgi:tRNA threonylcarbamoyladenosine biosynthesis protein TsaB
MKTGGALLMKILAIELSSDERSAAVLDTASGRLGVATEAGGRDSHPLAMIESALAKVGIEREEIERFAMGIGPGSYTGIRIGISLAQGWHTATGIKLMALSSLDSLACQWCANNKSFVGEVDFIVDAQRGDFHLAVYAFVNQNKWHIQEPLRLASTEEILNRLKQGRAVAGPGVTGIFPGSVDIYPQATDLVRLAATSEDFIGPEKLAPVYLRPVSFVKAPPPRVIE